jgi:hypothetical protein
MRQYIKKLQAKEEGKRKQIFAGVMIVAMSFVALIWVYSLGVRFGDGKVKTQAREDIKPFKLFSNSISDTFKNVSASVGKAPSVDKISSEISNENEKQIDLIPVEYPNQ